MKTYSDFEIFVRVVQQRSFTQAANQLGISKAYVSQQISALEKRLNTKLMNRTTRKLLLTDAGELFYSKSVSILDAIEEAEASVTEQQSTPTGTLRISAPPGNLGEIYITSIITRFMQSYPEIVVELDLSTRHVDLLSENYDLVIRAGILPDSTLIAKKLCAFDYYICASPTYIKEHGAPKSPAELKNHPCLVIHGAKNKWLFQAGNKKTYVKVNPRFTCNSGHGLAMAAIEGIGITRLPSFQIAEPLEQKKLRRLLTDYTLPGATLWLVYQQRTLIPSRLRLLIDYISEAFSKKSPWE